MFKGFDLFQKGMRVFIKREYTTRFWWDNWLSCGPLRGVVEGPLTSQESNLMVRDFWVNNSSDLSGISITLPEAYCP